MSNQDTYIHLDADRMVKVAEAKAKHTREWLDYLQSTGDPDQFLPVGRKALVIQEEYDCTLKDAIDVWRATEWSAS